MAKDGVKKFEAEASVHHLFRRTSEYRQVSMQTSYAAGGRRGFAVYIVHPLSASGSETAE